MTTQEAFTPTVEGESGEAIAAITRCRDIAMRQTVEARIPECGKFIEIAQDLDAALHVLVKIGITA